MLITTSYSKPQSQPGQSLATQLMALKEKGRILAKREVKSYSESAALICPISGLRVASNLPPLPNGCYLPVRHPLVDTLPELMTGPLTGINWRYLTSLSSELLSGALLISLARINKLDLDGKSPYLARLEIEKDWTQDQLIKALKFIKTRIYKELTNFGILKVKEAGLTTEDWDSYVQSIFRLTYFTENAEENGWIKAEDEEDYRPITIVSSERQAKRLDSNLADSFSGLAEWLPSAVVAKAKSFNKTLATHQSHSLIGSFLAGIGKYATTPSQLEEFNSFREEVLEARKKVEALGLYFDSAFDSFDYAPAPQQIQLDQPKPAKETFLEKMARLKKEKENASK
ncbi:p56 [Pseudomonas phage PaP2]|uniref:hypothetical protein n=1 Tax=Pseudomonas phage PaP2 TaxID=270673 RepID=UPI00003593EC|nr:hypothetical protein PaP2_gp56 [Pseudomonas phage PaP2]AAS89642.1 p56 [Pseudomonas phage PaP2]